MTEKQRAFLAAMTRGEPATAREIGDAMGVGFYSSVGAIGSRLAKAGYVEIVRSPHRNGPAQYVKLREAPPLPNAVRLIQFHRAEGGGYNRVSLPIEPWASA